VHQVLQNGGSKLSVIARRSHDSNEVIKLWLLQITKNALASVVHWE
jgi:hypothetical protein